MNGYVHCVYEAFLTSALKSGSLSRGTTISFPLVPCGIRASRDSTRDRYHWAHGCVVGHTRRVVEGTVDVRVQEYPEHGRL